MSPELRQYLTEWYEWATGDAVDGRLFDRRYGLCVRAGQGVRFELEALLLADFGGRIYPFGKGEYWQRHRDRTQHLCPKRLAWVREKLGLPDAEAAASEAEYRAAIAKAKGDRK